MKAIWCVFIWSISLQALSAAIFSDGIVQGDNTRLTLQTSLFSSKEDINKTISIYVVAIVPTLNNALFAKTPNGWLPFVDLPIPKYLEQVKATDKHPIDIIENLDVRSLIGTQIYVGYGLENGTETSNEMLQAKRFRQIHSISNTTSTNTPQGLSTIASCPSEISTPLLSTLPIDLQDFVSFRPLGFLSPPIHMFPAKHSAFSINIPNSVVGQPKAVKSPAKTTVAEIYEATFSQTGNKNYQIFLYPCREVRLYFGHLSTISDKLATAFRQEPPKCNSFDSGSGSLTTTCRRENLNVQLEEGEIFGTGPDTAGVDFGLVDFRRQPANFIELSHYDAYYPYYASPLDYFTAEPQQQLAAKTGDVFGTVMRTAQPIGGTYMQDIAGTAQGNWFLPDKYHRNNTDLSQFLGLIHDYIDPTQPIITMGSSIKGVDLGMYSYLIENTGLNNRDFSAIKPDGNVYCFDSFLHDKTASSSPLAGKPNGLLLMTMIDDKSLKVELVAGNSCATLSVRTFSNDATLFIR